MKQKEKLDLVLKLLYEEKEQSGDIVSLFKANNIDISLDEAFKIGDRLNALSLIIFTPTRDSAYASLESEGIEFVETDSFSRPESSILSSDDSLNLLSADVAIDVNRAVKPVEDKVLKDVFVTYAWDRNRPEHQELVREFVEFLRREEGFDAYMDLQITQQETAIDFKKMMHQAMTDYNKVIIVLSALYKKKAEAFEGGAGTEYQMIINQIETSKNKYILVSPYGREDDVVPHFFRGREIIDISFPRKATENNRLRAKLTDTPIYTFSDVGVRKQVEVAPAPKALQLAVERPAINIAIRELKVTYTSGQLYRGKYIYADYEIQASIQNIGNTAVSGLTMEVLVPNMLIMHLTYDELKGHVFHEEESYHVFSYSTAKLSPKQSFAGKPPEVKVTNYNDDVKKALAKPIIVRVYTDEGPIVRDFPLEETLVNSINSYDIKPLKVTDFASRDERW